jgi:hypothetical protein
MLDSCIWLAGTPGYPLSETQKVIVDMIMEDEEGEGGVTHFDRPVLLPHDLENYEGTYIISPGRPGIPASLPSWSQADEKKILDSLILELNYRLLAGHSCIWPSGPVVLNQRHLSADRMRKTLRMRLLI